MAAMSEPAKIAVLIPCYNEEATIGKVIDDFRHELPDAHIIVFDNNCTDATVEIARARRVEVRREGRQGKGFVIDTMFDDVDADVYVMVDGDDTYPAEKVHDLLAPVLDGQADMAIGARLAEYTDQSFRPLHVAGNALVRKLINAIFGAKLTDILSGYRVFNRRVVRRIPVISYGFEVETEMTIQMLYYRLGLVEVQVPYRERPEGSESKLRTFRDGFRVLWKLFSLVRSFKPLTFFGGVAILLFVLGALAGLPPVLEYFTREDHYITRVPLAILAASLMILSAGSLVLGLSLHAINWRLKEMHNVMVRRGS
jgi:glycosyltransferase involved in cell wall biosynthesis